ncbi:hypothetical protein LNV09_14725 [Paucibacter sp. B2R-40]|uniref:hypothetical protein n=1 Tax=Paucibacter sp. B2R-40 TaxID=2893554 RepID=UPI0021E4CE5A|nr:hypothetical protein [Paucibacter sp. B2R-40]MCV2355406.1 hypothetical protein [Paucibacter sp. B2R-40]
MPIVFVHGVNNRKSDEYRDNVVGRNEFLKEIVGPALGMSPQTLSIENPYWGDDGAQFAWNMAVLPDAEESYEKFGAGGNVEAFGRTVELISKSSQISGGVVDRARLNFAETVDLLYGAALAGVSKPEDANDIAKSYLLAVEYVASKPDLSWLKDATDDNFADLVNYYVNKNVGDEHFGAGGLLGQLKEGLSRLVNAIPDVSTELVGRLARKKLNTTVTRFAGDAFVYLAKRGEPGNEGPIVKAVLAGLKLANDAKNAKDDKLIVIAHSFGGEIMYDILTKYWPDLKVDCLITVGSQVGLFEEMKLYLASDKTIPSHYPDGKVPMPKNLARWLNVFDMNDVLSYRASPVFEGVQDFAYDTGYSTLQAHGGYFLRPSFYVRLAARLSK